MARNNFRIIGVCPKCSGTRIGFRRTQLPWFCSDCRITFHTPKRVRVDVQGHPEQYFLVEDVFRLEDSLRAAPSRNRQQGHPARSGAFDFPEAGLTGFSPKGCLIVVAIVAIAVIIGVAIANRNDNNEADAPLEDSTASQTASTLTLAPSQRHYEHKVYMLELINEERTEAGVPPVTLGDNIAAQLHAEAGLENCVGSHWGIDGLKPYMRYSLAGGYQANGENWLGADYCIKASDRYRALGSIRTEVREAIEGWMDSPGHRRNILGKWHKKVNIGLAWDKYNFVSVQHFEGDYVEYDELPEITSGTLSLSGRTTNGLRFSEKEDLGLQLFYDPPPQLLTRGQASRTYCYDSGTLIAAFRYPLTGNSFWTEDEFTKRHSPCPDPYDVSPNDPAPRSPDEAREFWERAYEASQTRNEQTVIVPWITASVWTARGSGFSVTADIRGLLSDYGPGVYTVLLWGEMGGDDEPVSEYSIFYEVDPPDTYNPDHWK